ncbi:hypothetical protein JXA31_01235 [Candidatus Bathyarchaeota archaeon]|nr:hypothetical protein [Candidatus Bathyarchaeota archaeon]
MNQKTIAIVVIAVVIVAVVGVAAYYFLGSGTGEPEATPTPSPGVEGASSLQFTVSATEGESAGTSKYFAKNIGTDDMMIRIEFEMEGGNLIYIVNGVQQKAWGYEGVEWVEYDIFADQLDLWKPVWQGYADNLSTWTSGDYTYTDAGGATVTVSGITVNPTLEDSLFEGGA